MKSQGDADEVSPIDLISAFNKSEIRYILIGSMALSMHGAPFGSADWDFWIHPDDRDKTTAILKQAGLDANAAENSPIQTFIGGDFLKLDIFFIKSFSNERKKIAMSFDEVFGRSIVKKDPDGSFYLRIPALNDIAVMLEIADTSRAQHAAHLEYVRALREDKASQD